jgi:hypothetical protein
MPIHLPSVLQTGERDDLEIQVVLLFCLGGLALSLYLLPLLGVQAVALLNAG